MKRTNKTNDITNCAHCKTYLKDTPQDLYCLQLAINNSSVLREEILSGKTYIVAPTIMMVEGVHHGSGGPVFYSAEELSKYPEAWNGRPVPVYHPETELGPISCNSPQVLEEQTIGQLFNTFFEDGKLQAEVWIDVEKAERISPIALNSIINGIPLDVSIGVFHDGITTQGMWNGEQYTTIARNLRPDHLALLPGQAGACSWEDGCGIRANHAQKTRKEAMGKTKKDPHVFSFPEGITTNRDYTQIGSAVSAILDAMDTEDTYYFLKCLTETTVCYSETGPEGSKYFQTNYTYNEEAKTVSFVGVPMEVVQNITYTPITTNQGESKMKKELIDGLIANKASQFTEDDRATLETYEEAILSKLAPLDLNVEPVVEVNNASTIEALKETLKTPADFLSLMPQDMQESIKHGLTMYNSKTAELSTHIKANSKYTDEMLANKTIEELEVLADAITPKADYSLQAQPVTNTAQEVEALLPVGV